MDFKSYFQEKYAKKLNDLLDLYASDSRKPGQDLGTLKLRAGQIRWLTDDAKKNMDFLARKIREQEIPLVRELKASIDLLIKFKRTYDKTLTPETKELLRLIEEAQALLEKRKIFLIQVSLEHVLGQQARALEHHDRQSYARALKEQGSFNEAFNRVQLPPSPFPINFHAKNPVGAARLAILILIVSAMTFALPVQTQAQDLRADSTSSVRPQEHKKATHIMYVLLSDDENTGRKQKYDLAKKFLEESKPGEERVVVISNFSERIQARDVDKLQYLFQMDGFMMGFAQDFRVLGSIPQEDNCVRWVVVSLNENKALNRDKDTFKRYVDELNDPTSKEEYPVKDAKEILTRMNQFNVIQVR